MLLVFGASGIPRVVAAESSTDGSLRERGSQLIADGDYNGAVALWTGALEQLSDQPVARAEVQLDLAAVYQMLGQHRLSAEALDEIRPDSMPRRIVASLRNLQGTLATARNEHEIADRLLSEALALAGEADAAPLRANILNNRGNLLAMKGNHPRALEEYACSAELADASGQKPLAARARVNAIRAAVLMKAGAQAETLLSAAEQSVTALKPSATQSGLWMALGRACEDAEDEAANGRWLKRARVMYRNAYGVARDLGDARSLSYALGYLGELYDRDGQPGEAVGLFERAIAVGQRANMPHALYRWKWGCARAEARRKRRGSALRWYRDAIETVRPIRHDLAMGMPDSDRPLRDLFLEFSDELLKEAAEETDRARVQALLREVRDTLESFKSAQLEDYFQDECVNIALSTARPVDAVAEGTAVIYVVPLGDRTELLVSLGHDRLERFRVGVAGTELTATVDEFRRLLEKRVTYEFLRPARRLHDWLIAPMEAVLVGAGVETLIFVPDGVLSTVPVAALFDGEMFLTRKYAVAVAPGLTLLGPKPLKPVAHQVLLAGVSEGVQGFSPLANVAAELKGLKESLGGTLLLNADFRKERLNELFSRNAFSIVHFASHGRFDGDVRETFLLAHDGRLTLDQLERLIKPSQFRGQPVELLTLSACQTASGDERAALGLAGVALKAGARSALATLWSVHDAATLVLVEEFYRNLTSGSAPVSKARALQLAQLTLMSDPRYDHPAFWAPYLIIGNWL